MTTSEARVRTLPSLAPGEISAGQVQALPAGQVKLLDVRSAGEFRTFHAPGALNVPLDEVGSRLDDLVRVPGPVVVVCHAGSRAAQAAERIAAAGKSDVHVLTGGMVAWQQESGAIERGKPTWALERQVRLVAGVLVMTGVLASVFLPGAQWLSFAVGAGLTFAAVSNTCMMGNLLAKLPYNRGSRADVDRAVEALLR